jgi:uncharacterized protein YcbK (DUF882 family)
MGDESSTTPDRSRRELVLVALGAVSLIPARAGARASAGDRWLELRNIHTKEVLKTTFQDANGFVADALSQLQHLLRDYRTGEEHEMDPGLYVQLSDLARAAGVEPRYEVISGYRSPTTNSMLHETGHNVSEHSLHMQGKAMDVRLRGYDLAALRDLALAAKRGGVGYYPHSNFIHVDTGRVRKWEGK